MSLSAARTLMVPAPMPMAAVAASARLAICDFISKTPVLSRSGETRPRGRGLRLVVSRQTVSRGLHVSENYFSDNRNRRLQSSISPSGEIASPLLSAVKIGARVMLSETLSSGLRRYRIGAKVHALRAAKELGLVELGKHTGLSPAMLSKIERGQLFPTLPTLLRIALVLGVGLEHFFPEDRRRAFGVTRKDERTRPPSRPGAKSPPYLFESLDFPVNDRKMEAYFA